MAKNKEVITTTLWVFTSNPVYLEIVNKGDLDQPIPFSFTKRDKKFCKFLKDAHNTVQLVTETKRIDGRVYHRECSGQHAVTRVLELPWERMFDWE